MLIVKKYASKNVSLNSKSKYFSVFFTFFEALSFGFFILFIVSIYFGLGKDTFLLSIYNKKILNYYNMTSYIYSSGHSKTVVNDKIVDENGYKFNYDGKTANYIGVDNDKGQYVKLNSEDIKKIMSMDRSNDNLIKTLRNHLKNVPKTKKKKRRRRKKKTKKRKKKKRKRL